MSKHCFERVNIVLGPGGGEWEGAKHAKKKKTKIKEAMKVDLIMVITY